MYRYCEKLVREFYDLYVETLRAQIDRRTFPAKKALLEHIRVCGKWVDISLLTIFWYVYDDSGDDNRSPLTSEFDYRWKLVKDG